MGLGFWLTGHYEPVPESIEAWLDSVSSWLEANGGDALDHIRIGEDHESRPTLFASFHPSAEEVELVVPRAGHVIASAKTTTAGPGYHIYTCDVLHRLGDHVGIQWDPPDEESGSGDETSYFYTGDGAAVSREFLKWLKSLATLVIEQAEEGLGQMHISMPLGHRYPHHGPMVTPMGPRDLDWLRRVAADPSQGIDLFPWWNEGLGGGFFLGQALTHLWSDVRWRKPLTEAEGDLLMDVHLDLCRAHACDPTLPFPWAEWRELIEHIEAYFGYVARDEGDVEPLVNQKAAEATGGLLIGYRRQPVLVDLTGGWSIEVRGEFAEEWDEEGTWSAWDGRRTVWFSSFAFSGDDGSQPSTDETLQSRDLPEGERFEHHGEGVVGIASFSPQEEDGQAMWNLSGLTAAAGRLGVSNVFVPTRQDLDWALDTWRSLDCAGSES
jgi:hypothetical protein